MKSNFPKSLFDKRDFEKMKKRNGFTLIELLVAITIGGVLIGLGSVSLNKFNEQQKVEAVKNEVLSNLRLARNYAVTNQLPSGTDKSTVTMDSLSEGFIHIRAQNPDGSPHATFSPLYKDVTPKGVKVVFKTSESSDPNTIKFSITDGRLIDNMSVGVTAVITITGGGVPEKKINIDKSGLIHE